MWIARCPVLRLVRVASIASAASIACAGALTACGGPPPPPPAPTGPAQWAELAPRPAEPAPKLEAVKRFQVVHAAAIPDVETLEATLARQGLVADVGDEAEGRVIEIRGVRCSVQPGPRLGDEVLPSPKIEPEYLNVGLSQGVHTRARLGRRIGGKHARYHFLEHRHHRACGAAVGRRHRRGHRMAGGLANGTHYRENSLGAPRARRVAEGQARTMTQ